jgi:glutamate-5-semialdehyde dehydrogenase
MADRELRPSETRAPDHAQAVARLIRAARVGAGALARASAEQRTAALREIAFALRRAEKEVLDANAADLDAAAAGGLGRQMTDRLRLAGGRFERMVRLVDELADAPDVLGRVERPSRAPNGLEVARMRIPLGVIAMIYESRPNVTTDAAACCVRSGNAAILRGGSESLRSNCALGVALGAGLQAAGLPPSAVQVVDTADRGLVDRLLEQDRGIDLVIPRGGEGLIRSVSERSRVPVLKHEKGVCHVYVHAEADLDMALAICINSKERPFTCHAAETFLVDRAVAADLVPRLCERLAAVDVAIRGDETVRGLAGGRAELASEEDWYAEYLDFIVAIRVVDGLDAAVAHIQAYGSDHTETIVTESAAAADAFLRQVDSSTVFVNASTRLAELPELGLGPELGTSTTRLHAYGPMGYEDLTTTKFVIRGNGQIKR